MSHDITPPVPTQRRDLIVLSDDAQRLITIPMPLVRAIDHVCDDAMCLELVERIESLGPSFAPVTTTRGFVDMPHIRNNDRVIFDDVTLASALFARLAPHLPMTRHGDRPDSSRRPRAEGGTLWRAVGLNERFRGYRYSPGQRFAPHLDGAFVRDEDERSAITVLLYLNEVAGGGETRILDWDVTCAPQKGSVLLFDHRVLHEGAEVTAGQKYVLRTDVMYRRVAEHTTR